MRCIAYYIFFANFTVLYSTCTCAVKHLHYSVLCALHLRCAAEALLCFIRALHHAAPRCPAPCYVMYIARFGGQNQ